LSKAGLQTTLLDKAQTLGGRCSSRLLPDNTGVFNFGAQYVEKQDSSNLLESLLDSLPRSLTSSKCWGDDSTERTNNFGRIFSPYMKSFPLAMGEFTIDLGTKVHTSSSVVKIQYENNKWTAVYNDKNLIDNVTEPHDAILLAIPSPQATKLLKDFGHHFEKATDKVEFEPCYAVMFTFVNLAFPIEKCFCQTANIKMASCEELRSNDFSTLSNKYSSWTILATPQWTRANINSPSNEVISIMLDEFLTYLNIQDRANLSIVYSKAHLWRYSQANKVLGESHLWDNNLKLGVCGDWCLGTTIHDAIESSSYASRTIIHYLTDNSKDL
jgi:predicted NAD/FAD-dependent oxidoreductase